MPQDRKRVTRTEAMRELGVSRKTLRDYCNQLGIPLRLPWFTPNEYAWLCDLREWVRLGGRKEDYRARELEAACGRDQVTECRMSG